MARIINNDTQSPVVIDAPWGGPQEGDENCYFAVTYDPRILMKLVAIVTFWVVMTLLPTAQPTKSWINNLVEY